MGDDAGPSVPFSLPTGTVTFLLTDIEGSSRQWESDAAAMGPAVQRHYEIVGECVTRWGGVRPVEQGEGDSIVAAFSRASDAVAAAFDAQRRLTSDVGAHFGVRIALHTGEAQLRDEGNYFGQAVIRCARLRSCGHGGQVLVSNTTADLVAERLPDGATLKDLGQHRLKDLQRPERVFELCHDDLPRAGGFPELRSLDAFRHNLPTQMAPLIGREREISDVIAMVERERLVTLTGTGGCGKSRLAAEVAARVADQFAGGVWWCELAPRRDENAVVEALAVALGVTESEGRPLALEVTERLRAEGEVFAVLDNAEHLLDAVARATVDLMEAAPGLRVVVTSREPLSVPGEVAWRVPSLAVPPADTPPVVEQLEDFAAVGLFVERAARSRSGFALTEENAAAVTAICRRLDGIPLAIELAAARVRTLAPERIAAQLDDRFRLLTGGSRTLLPRQQTLLASVAWSETLLDEQERSALRRLGVFVGGFSMEGAEAVLGAFDDTDAYEVLDLVGRLVDKSLVVFEEGSGRYRLLETIRSFALARLLEAGEGDAARAAHLAWAGAFAASQDVTFDATSSFPHVIAADWPNLAAAMEWASDKPEPLLAIVAGLGGFWLRAQRMTDAVRYGLESIERFASDPPPSWYRAVASAGAALLNAGVKERVGPFRQTALTLAREQGDETAVVLLEMELMVDRLVDEGLTEPVLAYAHEIDARARVVGLEFAAVNTALVPTQFLVLAGRIDEARPFAANLARVSRAVLVEGYAAMLRGEFDRAAAVLREAAEIAGRGDARQERLVVASGGEWLEVLTGGSVPAPAGRADLTSHVDLVGTWELMHAMASLRRLVLDRAWDRIDEIADLDMPMTTGGIRFEAMLACALMTAGRVADAAARAGALLVEADRRECPLQSIEAHLVLAECGKASDHAFEALALAAQYGLVLAQIDALEMLAVSADRARDPDRAARLKCAALAAREEIGYRFRWPSREAAFDAIGMASAAPFDSLDDAVAYAIRGRGERRRPAFGWESLTPTELEVARHVARGLTNPQVGEQLHIGAATVKTHLEHIYTKLGINSRAELATQLAREEPLPAQD